MTTKEKAMKLLKLFGPTGKHWTKNAFARNKKGKPILEDDPKAYKWCLVGGCGKLKLGEDWLDKAMMKYGYYSPVCFNDEDGFAPVKRVLQDIAGIKTKTKGKTK